jgi:hypothetical protein
VGQVDVDLLPLVPWWLLTRECSNAPALRCPQLQDDNLWAKWIDVAFSKLDLNSDGFISVDEIVRAMPGDSQDESDRLLAISKVCHRPRPPARAPSRCSCAQRLVPHAPAAAVPCMATPMAVLRWAPPHAWQHAPLAAIDAH